MLGYIAHTRPSLVSSPNRCIISVCHYALTEDALDPRTVNVTWHTIRFEMAFAAYNTYPASYTESESTKNPNDVQAWQTGNTFPQADIDTLATAR